MGILKRLLNRKKKVPVCQGAVRQKPVKMDVPYAVPGLHLEDGPCYAETFCRCDRETDGTVQSDPVYYANSRVAGAVAAAVREVEGLMAPAYEAVPGLPALWTDTSAFVPVDSISDLPEPDQKDCNVIKIAIHPLTPTGKKAKYPVEVRFFSEKQSPFKRRDGALVHTTNGSHGTLYFLQDGTVGKAEICYWKNFVLHVASFRMFGGKLGLSRISRQELESDDERRVIYEAGRETASQQ